MKNPLNYYQYDELMILKDVLGRPIAYHRVYAVFAGVTGAVFLSQAIHWTPRTRDEEGWFYKSRNQWTEETGLTRYEQETARKKLRKLGILEEKKEGMPNKLFYRVNPSRMNFFLYNTSSTDMDGGNHPTSRVETTQLEGGKPTNSTRGEKHTKEKQRESKEEKISQTIREAAASPNLSVPENTGVSPNLVEHLKKKKARKENKGKWRNPNKPTTTTQIKLTKEEGLIISLTDNVDSSVIDDLSMKYEISREDVIEEKQKYINWVMGSSYEPKVWGKDMKIYVERFCSQRSSKNNKVKSSKPKDMFEEINAIYKCFPR